MKPQIAPLFSEEMRQRIAFVLQGLTGTPAVNDVVERAKEGFVPDPKLIGMAMDALFRYETDKLIDGKKQKPTNGQLDVFSGIKSHYDSIYRFTCPKTGEVRIVRYQDMTLEILLIKHDEMLHNMINVQKSFHSFVEELGVMKPVMKDAMTVADAMDILAPDWESGRSTHRPRRKAEAGQSAVL
jgi:hypothetical protein